MIANIDVNQLHYTIGLWVAGIIVFVIILGIVETIARKIWNNLKKKK